MSVREATLADISWVADLEAQTFGVDAWSTETVADELLGDRRVALVDCEPASDDAAPTGYAVVLLGGDVADLLRIAVAAPHRRTGLGRVLLDEATARAGAAGADRMLLEVSSANTSAVAFYSRLGFAVIDRRARYYRDGTDALVMQRVLGLTREET